MKPSYLIGAIVLIAVVAACLVFLRGTRTSFLTKLGRSGNSHEFAATLSQGPMWMLSCPLPAGVDPATLTQKALLEMIEKYTKELSEAQSHQPFVYQKDAHSCLPLFTSMKRAQQFVESYVREKDRVIPFSVLELSQGNAAFPVFSQVDKVIVNARTDDEYTLTSQDLHECVKIGGDRDRDAPCGAPLPHH